MSDYLPGNRSAFEPGNLVRGRTRLNPDVSGVFRIAYVEGSFTMLHVADAPDPLAKGKHVAVDECEARRLSRVG